jgi:hypothetical protein
MATRKMHQTTVRFGQDLWEALEDECAGLGVSVAQYLREAALTRLVYAAGRRGDDAFEFALELATGRGEEPGSGGHDELEAVAGRVPDARDAKERAARRVSESAALAAQGQLARQRARAIRERSERFRTG